jgi:hypothetical protein
MILPQLLDQTSISNERSIFVKFNLKVNKVQSNIIWSNNMFSLFQLLENIFQKKFHKFLPSIRNYFHWNFIILDYQCCR